MDMRKTNHNGKSGKIQLIGGHSVELQITELIHITSIRSIKNRYTLSTILVSTVIQQLEQY